MKLFANGTSNDKDFAILKDNEKFNKDVDSEDVVASNATKMTYKDGKVTSYVVPIDASETKEEEQASRCLRHLWLYERRMDRGLFCALGFIIILCLVGMATSIGGALYLKFRSHGNSTPMSLIVPVSRYKFLLFLLLITYCIPHSNARDLNLIRLAPDWLVTRI